ncbi:hypothetical protein BB558_003336 [Smittium angustum]|uniref:ATPase AAA-type core domain-containing protein n=1 Tax=Smittium angustum TaxID=133377 RepID=A0A2U1J690_SMIAN|nr:hypothetical protein BB558_003336 [Smittium angustum]
MPSTITDKEYFRQQLILAKRCIIGRLSGRDESSVLVGIEKPYRTLFDTLERTIKYGESNSVMVLGPKSSGKSTMIKKVISDLELNYNQENEQNYYIVKLSGLIHSTDRIALKSIASQLHQNMNIEDTIIDSTPVIFILENFELFAMQPRQLLLYTLLDIAQSRQAPVAIVGVTNRMNVIDLLEKRVKSRFSHRQILVPLVSSSEEFLMIAYKNLLLPTDLYDIDQGFIAYFNSKIKLLMYFKF